MTCRFFYDDKDLIYEGIATIPSPPDRLIVTGSDDKDLIYEGIATSSFPAHFARAKAIDDKDLIYEGIATNRIHIRYTIYILVS